MNLISNRMIEKQLITRVGKLAVPFSADTFLVNQKLVLRINPPAGGW